MPDIMPKASIIVIQTAMLASLVPTENTIMMPNLVQRGHIVLDLLQRHRSQFVKTMEHTKIRWA